MSENFEQTNTEVNNINSKEEQENSPNIPFENTNTNANIESISSILQNHKRILYLSFNQECTRLNCGTEQGFIIFGINPLKVRYQRMFKQGIGIVEILYRCNMLALVGGGQDPAFPLNTMVIWDDRQNKKILELEFHDRVLGIKLRKDSVIVVTVGVIKVFKFSDMTQIMKIRTASNPHGVCAMSTNLDAPVLICPGTKVGTVNIVNWEQQTQKIVSCHQNPIRTIAISSDASKFATASEVGTLIRVFDVSTQNRFKEFRRGTEVADIFSMNFSSNSKCLALTSNKATIHMFSLAKEFKNHTSNLNFISGMLPQYFSSEWSISNVPFPPPPPVLKALEEELFSIGGGDTDINSSPGAFVSNPPGINGKISVHIACIPYQKVENEDIYQLFVVSYDGRYMTYEFQMKDKKIERKSRGWLFNVEAHSSTTIPLPIPMP